MINKLKVFDFYFIIYSLIIFIIFLVISYSDRNNYFFYLFPFIAITSLLCLFVLSDSIKNIYLLISYIVIFFTIYASSSLPGWKFFFDNSFKFVSLFYFILLFLWILNNDKFTFSSILGKDKLYLRIYTILFLMSIVINLSSLNSGGFFRIVSLAGAFLTMFFIIPPVLLDVGKSYESFVKLLFIIGVLIGTAGIITIFFNINPNSDIPNASISIFHHTNYPSFLYNITIPCGLYYIYRKRDDLSLGNKLISYTGIAIMVIANIFTYSRSGLISMFFVIAIYLFLVYRKQFFFIVPVFILFFLTYFKNIVLTKGTGTTFSRLGLLAASINLLKSSFSNFLWGFGPVNAFTNMDKYKDELNVMDSHSHPHNSIVFFILLFGLIPFIPLLFLIIKTQFNLFKKLTFDFNNNAVFLLPFMIISALLLQSIFEDHLLFPDFFAYHIFLIFLGIVFLRLSNDKYRITPETF